MQVCLSATHALSGRTHKQNKETDQCHNINVNTIILLCHLIWHVNIIIINAISFDESLFFFVLFSPSTWKNQRAVNVVQLTFILLNIDKSSTDQVDPVT